MPNKKIKFLEWKLEYFDQISLNFTPTGPLENVLPVVQMIWICNQ